MATLIERVFREQWGKVLASLVGFLGDFDLAEEAPAETFAIAAERWQRVVAGHRNDRGARCDATDQLGDLLERSNSFSAKMRDQRTSRTCESRGVAQGFEMRFGREHNPPKPGEAALEGRRRGFIRVKATRESRHGRLPRTAFLCPVQ